MDLPTPLSDRLDTKHAASYLLTGHGEMHAYGAVIHSRDVKVTGILGSSRLTTLCNPQALTHNALHSQA